jgi:cell division protein FtsB
VDELAKIAAIIASTLASLLAALTIHAKVFLPSILQAVSKHMALELDRRDAEREKLFDALLERVRASEAQIDRLRDRTPLNPQKRPD